MNKLKQTNKMSSLYRHTTLLTNINHNLFICILLSLALPTARESAARTYDDKPNIDEGGRRLTREYHLRQGALRGLIVKPSRQYDLPYVEMFLGIPYAAPPTGNLRFMPPVSAVPWPGVKMATRLPPVCPQMLPVVKKNNPPTLGRQNYMNSLRVFLKNESEDCLYLNIYVPYREQKSKKFPVLVFIHGDSFEWSSGNPYDGRVLASYGNIMVVTVNFRLGVLGFMKPSLTEHAYGNNGLLDQLAALQWIKDNIEDLNGDPGSVTLMGHGTGAACVNFLMMSPLLSNGLFHRAILMSGSALSDWALTKDPTQYTLQVAQSLGCNPSSDDLMKCLQNKPLSDIKRAQILAREFETPLGPVVAGAFVPNEPAKTMESYPNLLSKYQLLSGVTELESYHDFGVIELAHGVLETQRDDFIKKYVKLVFEGGEEIALKDILKQYSLQKGDPQRWSVEINREFILNVFSDARTVAPLLKTVSYQSKANSRSYFYVFGHNSESTEYAALKKSVHGEEMPYVLGVPLGGVETHFHSEYTLKEKLLSEAVMRLWTNFVKNGSPNTQSTSTNSKYNEYYTLDRSEWRLYNIEWPEYNVEHKSFLKLDIPPYVGSFYRSNYTRFWTETLPNKMKRYIVDPLFEFTHVHTTQKPKAVHRNGDTSRRNWNVESPHRSSSSYYGRVKPDYSPSKNYNTDFYKEIKSIDIPAKPMPKDVVQKLTTRPPTPNIHKQPKESPITTSSTTLTLIIFAVILFLLINIAVGTALYLKKKKLSSRQRVLESDRNPRNGSRNNIKAEKEDKSALKSFKNGYSALKSMGINKMRSHNKDKKPKVEECKTPKSDDSGGFGERFRLRRHLSTSTLDAHTKVRDWITSDVMHRCSPSFLRKSNSDLCNDAQITPLKPYTRSEELLSDNIKSKQLLKHDISSALKPHLPTKQHNDFKYKTTEKTTSTSAIGSTSSMGTKGSASFTNIKKNNKSSDSLQSKESGSITSKKVSVAIDATPAARTNSILQQQPIEISKSFEKNEDESKPSMMNSNMLLKSKTEKCVETSQKEIEKEKNVQHKNKIFTSVVSLPVSQDSSKSPLKILHKHSSSDPVTDVNYGQILMKTDLLPEKFSNIPPPASFSNEINVTSKEEKHCEPLSPAEALLTIKRRNYPKVLPDFPSSQKRLSLQPTCQTIRSYINRLDSQMDMRPKLPPQPPPRTTTLERRLAYKNSKPLSSFGSSSNDTLSQEGSLNKNYENIENFSSAQEIYSPLHRKKDTFDQFNLSKFTKDREIPKVIIASSDMSDESRPKFLIAATPQQGYVELPANIPRVTLPDDFHSTTLSSFPSCGSSYSEDDEDILGEEFLDDIADDKLIQELVGGVDSPTEIEQFLDTKGPDPDFLKKLEIVPVKVKTDTSQPRSKEEYIFISDLVLPEPSGLERTVKIKPHLSSSKSGDKCESIQKPLEKADKVRHQLGFNPTSIFNRAIKSKDSKKEAEKRDISSLYHSNSGSSNDTQTSTGTVKRVPT